MQKTPGKSQIPQVAGGPPAKAASGPRARLAELLVRRRVLKGQVQDLQDEAVRVREEILEILEASPRLARGNVRIVESRRITYPLGAAIEAVKARSGLDVWALLDRLGNADTKAVSAIVADLSAADRAAAQAELDAVANVVTTVQLWPWRRAARQK